MKRIPKFVIALIIVCLAATRAWSQAGQPIGTCFQYQPGVGGGFCINTGGQSGWFPLSGDVTAAGNIPQCSPNGSSQCGKINVNGVHFGTTAIPFSTTPPTAGQSLVYDGSKIGGSSGGGGLTCTAGTTPVTSGSVGCNTVTVSSAQLLAINGNPVTLIAAPGVGKLISVIAENATFAFSGSAYAGGSFPGIAYTNSNGDSASSGSFPTKSLITAAASSFETWTGITTPTLLTTANDVNQPIVFEDTANYTTGSGTLTISVLYTVVTP